MTISRENRIKIRSEMYAKGEIDLQTFFDLESMDEDPEEPEDLTGLSGLDNNGQFPKTDPVRPEVTPTKNQKKSVKITKEDFNKLSLNEQQELFNEDPESVKTILGVK